MKPSRFGSVLALLLATPVGAAELHVSPSGDDRNPGTQQRPLQTAAAAQKAVRALRDRSAEPVTILFHAGIYYLPEPLVFTPEDSGSPDAPVLYAAAPGEEAVWSGGLRLALTWQPHRDGLVKATVPATLATDQLFVNGQRQHLAR